MKKKRIFVLFICFISFSIIFGYNAVWGNSVTLEELYTRTFINLLKDDPELLTIIGLSENSIFNSYSGELTDVSPKQQKKKMDDFENDIRLLKTFNIENLKEEEKLSYDIYKWYFQNEIDGKKFMYYDYPVNQYEGIQNKLPEFLTTIHSVSDKQSAEKYVERLSKVNVKFEGLIEGLKLREEKGIIPPKFVLEKVIKEMRSFIAPEPKNNILITSFVKKVDKTNLDEKEKMELSNKAEYQVATSVYPAYKNLIVNMERLIKKANNDAGVWKFSDGDAYYAYKLKAYTTTSLTPEQIHQIGLDEVARIEKEMKDTINKLGYTDVEAGEFMKNISKENRFKYPDTEEGRRAVIEDYKVAIVENNRNVEDCFDLKPKGEIEVRPVPEFKQNTSELAYFMPTSSDGLRPSILYINLGKMEDILKYNTKSLAAHEGIPGHHIQRGIQRQLKNVPMFRKAVPFTAFAEGWAMYSEQLSWEQSYEKDSYNNLGRLQTELWRAVRLVVDTGIHYKRWTREQAIHYMVKTTGMPQNAVGIEVERYIVDPGQACAYKIGMLKFLELRQKAKQTLGERFNIKEFHNAVLKNGAMPLAILEKQVDQYINSKL